MVEIQRRGEGLNELARETRVSLCDVEQSGIKEGYNLKEIGVSKISHLEFNLKPSEASKLGVLRGDWWICLRVRHLNVSRRRLCRHSDLNLLLLVGLMSRLRFVQGWEGLVME